MNNEFENNQTNSNPFGAPDFTIEDIGLDANMSEDAGYLPSIAAGEHRLNDLDSNLFSESAYKGVDNEIFQLEYKINRTENKLKRIQANIASAAAINDIQQLKILHQKKIQYEAELKKLYYKYNNQGLSSKISGELINIVTKNPTRSAEYIRKAFEFLNKNIFSKFLEKFDSAIPIKEALVKLETINQNVDELVSRQTPYGESPEKYTRLLQYLNKANNIQSQISQIVKKYK